MTEAENTRSNIRVAVVEDDDDLLSSTLEFLSDGGYSVWGVPSAEDFFRTFSVNPVDVIVLDIGLPGEDGLSVARLLQENRGIAVIILSARDSVDDRLAGLRAGADRYLVKPIDLQELSANIDAAANRLKDVASSRLSEKVDPKTMPVLPSEPTGAWLLDLNNWVLTSPKQGKIKLTAKELTLLYRLILADTQAVSKRELAEEIFGARIDNGTERLNVLLARLRKKVSTELGCELPLKTIHQLGYVFTEPVKLD